MMSIDSLVACNRMKCAALALSWCAREGHPEPGVWIRQSTKKYRIVYSTVHGTTGSLEKAFEYACDGPIHHF